MEISGIGIIMLQCIAHDPTYKARYLLQASKEPPIQIERLRASIYADRDSRGARRGGFCDRGLFFEVYQIKWTSLPVKSTFIDSPTTMFLILRSSM
jgi:hypothetical protein